MPLPVPAPDATALITGASSGIGVDLARQLAQRGHGVTLVARREERLRTVADELSSRYGVRAEVLACDLADATARDALPARVEQLGLTVNVLVNNAGYGTAGPFIELDVAREVDMVRLNCEAVVALTGVYAPQMAARDRGAILIVASSAGVQPIPNQATYAASKAFALSLSEALHVELRKHGVVVTALCPGPVETEFAAVADMEKAFSNAPSFSLVSPEECARQAIDGLDNNKRVVTPGLAIRAVGIAGRYTPHSVLLPMIRKFYPV